MDEEKKRELVSVGSRDELTHKLSFFSGIKAYLKIGEAVNCQNILSDF
jgi:hypothetical protein